MSEIQPPGLPPPPGSGGPEGPPPDRWYWLVRLTGAIKSIGIRLAFGIKFERVKPDPPDINDPDKLERQLLAGGSHPDVARKISDIFRKKPDSLPPPEEPKNLPEE